MYYYYVFGPILSTSDQNCVMKGNCRGCSYPRELTVMAEARSRGINDGTLGLVPCYNLLSCSWAKSAAVKVRYLQWFQQSVCLGKKICKFLTLLFCVIAHYGRNRALDN